jgi:hypothetical protein
MRSAYELSRTASLALAVDPSADGCLPMQVAASFSMQPARGIPVLARASPGSSRRVTRLCPGPDQTGQSRNPDECDGTDGTNGRTQERRPDDSQAGRVPLSGDVISGGDLGATRAAARGPRRGRETQVSARRCSGAAAARSQATDAMTSNHISIPPGPARQCTRCGALGTHYLTCPILRLPRGYRFSQDPTLGSPVTAGQQHITRRSANG